MLNSVLDKNEKTKELVVEGETGYWQRVHCKERLHPLNRLEEFRRNENSRQLIGLRKNVRWSNKPHSGGKVHLEEWGNYVHRKNLFLLMTHTLFLHYR